MNSNQNQKDIDFKASLSNAYAIIRSQLPWSHPKSPEIMHHRVLPHATYSPWLLDENFLNIYALIKEHTLVDIYRCYELWTLAHQLQNVPGNFLEVGVWRGGTGALLAKAIDKVDSDKLIFLADTFSGVVKAGADDTVYSGGEHADTSIDIVSQLFNKLNLLNYKLLEGIFPEQTAISLEGKIAFLHCDVDVYSSAKGVVEWTIPRLSTGGAIIFDDYGFSGCEGVTRLVNELRVNKEFIFVHNLNGHAILIKK
jgi:O-methyltransferase